MGDAKVRMGVAFDGEKEVKSAISNINAQLKTLKSEADKVASAFEGQEKSEAALAAKSEVLNRTLTTQKSKISELEAAVKKAQQHEDAWKEKVSDTEQELDKQRRALDRMKETHEETSDEVQKQEKAVKELEDQLSRYQQTATRANTNTEKWKTTLNKAQTELNRTQKELDQTDRDLDQMGDEAKDTAGDMEKLEKSTHGVSGKLSSLSVAFGSFMGNLALDALQSAASALRDFAGSVVELGKNFDSSMSNVQALSGATASELERLESTARQAGKTTVFSATESADALSYMALAGWDVDQMVEGLPAILNLAASAQMDLAEASDIVTDYVTAFGLSVEDSAHLADVMAYAMSHSNTDVTQLGEAYKNVAATAGSLGYTLEDTTAVLMTMANAGVKGGEAGTALNAIMSRLATDTKGCASELKEYGVEVYDAEGNMNNLSEILIGMSDVWSQLTEEQQANMTKTLAGTNHYSALSTIIQGLSDEAKKSGSSFQDYTKALEECDGTAQEMSKTMNDNLAGDLKTLNSVWEDFKLTLYDTQSGAMREIVQTISGSLIPALQALVTGADNAKEMIANAFSDILDTVGDIGGSLVTSLFGEEAGAAVQEAIGAISDAIDDIFALFDDIGPIISQLIQQGSQAFQTLLPPILDIIQTLLPFISKIVEVLGKLANAILPILKGLLEGINAILGPILKALEPLLDILGAIFDAISWVVNGIGWLLSGCPKVAENFEEVKDSASDMNKELGKTASAWDSMIQSQEKAFASSSVEIGNIQAMASELDTLIGKNGKVKEGYEARANYLTGKLSEATGVEISCIDGVVDKYDELKQSIEDVIAAKKTSALIDYYQGILDTFEAGTGELGIKLAQAEDELKELERSMADTTDTDKWNELNDQYVEMNDSVKKLEGQYETAMLAEARLYDVEKAAAEGNNKKLKELYDNKEVFYFEDGEAYLASELQKRDGAEKTVEILTELNEKYTNSNDETAQKTIKTNLDVANQNLATAQKEAAQEVETTRQKFSQMSASTTGFVSTVLSAMSRAGTGGGSNFVNGMLAWLDDAYSAGKGLKSNSESGASGTYSSGNSLGSDFGSGFWNGVTSWAGRIRDAAYNAVANAVAAAKRAQDSASPSKETRKLGRYFSEGYALGIKDEMKKAAEAAEIGVNETLNTVSKATVTMIPSLATMRLFDSVNAQNGSIEAAILRLESKLTPKPANVYNVNGITYDDGSNVSGAVRDLIHAAKIERRV